MQCPGCKIQLHVGRSYTAVEDGKAVTVQEMVCTNPRCAYFKANIPARVIRHRHTDEQGTGVLACSGCGRTLARITDTSYTIAPGVDYKAENGLLSMSCPECGIGVSVDVENKTEWTTA